MIGISASLNYETEKVELREEYYLAVLAAGGVPVILPPGDSEYAARVMEAVNGIVLSGGVDIDPFHFGEPVMRETGRISPERDEFEIALVQSAMSVAKPVLGICRGIQVLNVAAGGTLYQDIYSANPDGSIMKHCQDAPDWYGTHPIKIVPGSRLEGILGAGLIQVNSMHHQAIKELGRDFEVTATSPDGVIEAIEWKGPGFIIGVQWHPETMWQKNRVFLNLFTALVEEARRVCS